VAFIVVIVSIEYVKYFRRNGETNIFVGFYEWESLCTIFSGSTVVFKECNVKTQLAENT
jgi:hypothetical protein